MYSFTCLNCHRAKQSTNRFAKYCNHACRWEYEAKTHPNPIDEELKKLVTLPRKRLLRGDLTLIASKLSVSRERVRQRAEKMNLIMPSEPIIKRCIYCSGEFPTTHPKTKFCSSWCELELHLYTYYELRICKRCNKGYLSFRNKSNSYRHDWLDNIDFIVGRELFSVGREYCSTKCWGKELGTIYGFGLLNNPTK